LVCLDGENELTIPRTTEAWNRVLYSWTDAYVGECEIPEPEVVEEDEESTPSVPVENTFHRDTRCLNRKPSDVTWSLYENDLLTWSAVGGDKVEVRFGYSQNNLPYSFVTTNDGHEAVGLGTDAGFWSGYWQMRTINGCRTGDWSEVLSGHGTW